MNPGFETDLSGWTAGDSTWWLTGGVSPDNVIAAYQALGRESYAQSKINLHSPGVHDLKDGNGQACTDIDICLTGSSPAWNNRSGWSFDGISNYLATDIHPSDNHTVIARFANGQASGIYHVSGLTSYSSINSNKEVWQLLNFEFDFGQSSIYGFDWPNTPKNGVSAAAGKKFYYNGQIMGEISGEWIDSESTSPMFIGAVHYSNTPSAIQDFALVKGAFDITALAVYDTQLSTNQINALTIAMNNLSGNSVTRSTDVKYDGEASAKATTISDFIFTQPINFGSQGIYELSVRVNNNGVSLTSENVQLYYGGTAIPTSYHDSGNGWYTLTGSVQYESDVKDVGVLIKAGQSLYVDAFAISKAVTAEIPISDINSDIDQPDNTKPVSIPGTVNDSTNQSKSNCRPIVSGNSPTIFQVNATATSITLFLDADNQPNIIYHIAYSDSPHNLSKENSYSPLSTEKFVSYTFEDLLTDTSYYFKVRKSNGCTLSPWSSITEMKTKPKNIVISTPNAVPLIAPNSVFSDTNLPMIEITDTPQTLDNNRQPPILKPISYVQRFFRWVVKLFQEREIHGSKAVNEAI